jgi:drug/metabolite transporter (DMT)-like permease
LGPTELALVLASALLHALWSASIKQSADPLCFNLFQLPLTLVVLAAALPFFAPADVPAGVWRLLPLTAVTHALYAYWMCRAYEHGDLSLVYPIARSTPAFLPFVAVPLLGERLSFGGALGIAVVVSGVWLVQGVDRWTLRELRQPAARFAFLTLAATVGYSLIDKAAMASFAQAPWRSAVPISLVYYLLLSTAHGALFTALVLRRRGAAAVRAAATPAVLRAATLSSAASLVGYTLILQALATASASYVVAVRQSSVIFALALGSFWLRERPGTERIAGAVATVVGVALIAAFR